MRSEAVEIGDDAGVMCGTKNAELTGPSHECDGKSGARGRISATSRRARRDQRDERRKKRKRAHVVPPVPAAVGLVRVVRHEDAGGGYRERKERAAERRGWHPEPHEHARPRNE